MEKYRILGKKGEGTFSEVLKCQNVRDGTFWAVKKMKQTYKSMDEVQQIREVRVLKQLNGHPNIIFLREIIFDKRTGTLCLIFELMTMNLYEYIRGRQRLLSSDIVCKFMYQLLKSLEYLHRHSFFHRDIKPENILIKDDILKLADFGSCRQTSSKHPYTEYISTRWYRAPECLLTDGYYRCQMDIWSAGCVMFEIVTLQPLFPGSNELDQLNKIHEILGTPSSSTLEKFQHRNSAVDFNFPARRGTGIARHLSHCSSDTVDLLNQLCTYDPDHRVSAAQALRHPYFEAIRKAENQQLQKTAANPWENNIRVTKTSEDRYIRSNSSSSQSSTEEVATSPRSNVYSYQQANKVDYNRLIYPSNKAQSLIEARTQKPTMQNRNQSNYHYNQQHQSPTYYHSNYPSGGTSNGSSSFLPRISGASAFGNYHTNNPSSMTTKTNYPAKNIIGYYPIMSYRSYKK